MSQNIEAIKEKFSLPVGAVFIHELMEVRKVKAIEDGLICRNCVFKDNVYRIECNICFEVCRDHEYFKLVENKKP